MGLEVAKMGASREDTILCYPLPILNELCSLSFPLAQINNGYMLLEDGVGTETPGHRSLLASKAKRCQA